MDEKPSAPSYLRILYLGKILQDEDTLAGELRAIYCARFLLPLLGNATICLEISYVGAGYYPEAHRVGKLAF